MEDPLANGKTRWVMTLGGPAAFPGSSDCDQRFFQVVDDGYGLPVLQHTGRDDSGPGLSSEGGCVESG